MGSEDSRCAACGAALPDPTSMVYSRAGELVCDACFAREQSGDAAERVEGNRTFLIVSAAASLAGVTAFGLWSYAYHDKTYVYVHGGGDASDRLIKTGLALALFAAAIVGGLVARLLGRMKKRPGA